MKKNVIICGLISGAIVSAMLLISTAMSYKDAEFKGSMILGYTSMILAFSLIFVGIKSYRDKYNNGSITFGKAFMTGLYIVLISSTFYVVTWMIELYLFIPDFMEKYIDHMIKEAQQSGVSAAEMAKKTEEMDMYRQWYKNPILVILLTYMEILPVGLVANVICALILKRKAKEQIA